MKKWKNITKIDVIDFSNSVLSIEPESAEIVQVNTFNHITRIIIVDKPIGSFQIEFQSNDPDELFYYIRGDLPSNFRLYGIDLTEMMNSLKYEVRQFLFKTEMTITGTEKKLLSILNTKEDLLSKDLDTESITTKTMKKGDCLYHIDFSFISTYKLSCLKISSIAGSTIFMEDKSQLDLVDCTDLGDMMIVRNMSTYFLGLTEEHRSTLINQLNYAFNRLHYEIANCEKNRDISIDLLSQIDDTKILEKDGTDS